MTKAAIVERRGWGTPDRIGIPFRLVIALAVFIPLSYLMLVPRRPSSSWST